MSILTFKLATGYSCAAGAISGLGSVLISVQFWQALIIAAVTGLLAALGTIIGTVIAARVAAKSNEDLHRKLDDVKGIVGANRRRHNHDE
jgi:uncharacterized membrane protein YfcA